MRNRSTPATTSGTVTGTRKRMTDFLFGWFTGLMTIIVPYLGWEIYRLRKQVKFLVNPEETVNERAPFKKKKPWWKL